MLWFAIVAYSVLLLAMAISGLTLLLVLSSVAFLVLFGAILLPKVELTRSTLTVSTPFRSNRVDRKDVEWVSSEEYTGFLAFFLLDMSLGPRHENLVVGLKNGQELHFNFIVTRPKAMTRLVSALEKWKRTGDSAGLDAI